MLSCWSGVAARESVRLDAQLCFHVFIFFVGFEIDIDSDARFDWSDGWKLFTLFALATILWCNLCEHNESDRRDVKNNSMIYFFYNSYAII
jgi:hypothetical protein